MRRPRAFQPVQRPSEEGWSQHCLPKKREAALKMEFKGKPTKSLRMNGIQTGFKSHRWASQIRFKWALFEEISFS